MALTKREQDIAPKIIQGKLNKEIAYELGLSNGTVKQYIATLCHKMKCRNRVELAVKLVREERNEIQHNPC